MSISNIILKPLPFQPQKPLKMIPSASSQNLNELFNNIRNSVPFSFVEVDSPHITICQLTPKINEQSLRIVCQEYGKIIQISIKAYYKESQANIVANITYENSEQAKLAYQELHKKVEIGFHFQIYLGKNPQIQETQIIKIQIPNTQIKTIIDRLAKQVVKEGNEIEKQTMQKEINNSKFAFLFFKCDENEYYKWKIYSLSNGDDEKQWKQEPYYFNINENIFIPPGIEIEEVSQQNFAKKELEKAQITIDKKKKTVFNILDDTERNLLHQQIRELNTQKHIIGKVMVFTIDHSNCAADIVLILEDSLKTNQSWTAKLARLYLISDILHNCNSTFKNYFQWCLASIFSSLEQLLPYKEKVLKLLQCWRESSLYDPKFIKGLELSFLMKEKPLEIESTSAQIYKDKLLRVDDDTLDRICRLKGLTSQGTKNDIIQRLVQHKFYNRVQPDVSLDQVSKYVQVYRHIVDKDQQTIMSSQKQSFITQIQLMQEFLKLLQKRYKNIINIQGEEIDEIDEKIFEFQKNIEYQKLEKNLYQQLDGKDLTEEDIKIIEEKKVQVISNYELTFLIPKPPLPPPPSDVIEIEVQKFREVLTNYGLYEPFKVDEYVKSKRLQLIKLEQIKKEKERQLLLKQQQELREKEKEKEKQRYNQRGINKQTNQRSSSSESEKKKNAYKKKYETKYDSKYEQKHYKRKSKSRSDSRKKKSYNKKR